MTWRDKRYWWKKTFRSTTLSCVSTTPCAVQLCQDGFWERKAATTVACLFHCQTPPSPLVVKTSTAQSTRYKQREGRWSDPGVALGAWARLEFGWAPLSGVQCLRARQNHSCSLTASVPGSVAVQVHPHCLCLFHLHFLSIVALRNFDIYCNVNGWTWRKCILHWLTV